MSTFGSTEDSDPIPREVIEKKLTKMERATVSGCLREMDILKQKLELCYEKLSRMTNLYQMQQRDFAEFKAQRMKELQMKINHGPTVVENGTND